MQEGYYFCQGVLGNNGCQDYRHGASATGPQEYDSIVEELDNRVLELEAQLHEIEDALRKERAESKSTKINDRLNKRVIIGVFADVEGEAKIKNASRYTLLRGTGSVYVDGSFISSSKVPAVSPEESFDCPLGLDPSLRVKYHPLSKQKQYKSEFYTTTSTTTHVYTQTVTVYNTKSIPVECVRIADQVPVSEDEKIQVKLITPALVVKDSEGNGRVAVAEGVSAMWEGADEAEPDTEALGSTGRFDWVVALPPWGKVDLVLRYEVAYPTQTETIPNGLDSSIVQLLQLGTVTVSTIKTINELVKETHKCKFPE
ncbi:hypothetical protein C0993_006037 [Termitomyces sp. T159_Od127]|nr:hypothetical protein C0993_006037 [Termitomyces sp. T159_Od127]